MIMDLIEPVNIVAVTNRMPALIRSMVIVGGKRKMSALTAYTFRAKQPGTLKWRHHDIS